jgi:hypothetical protein
MGWTATFDIARRSNLREASDSTAPPRFKTACWCIKQGKRREKTVFSVWKYQRMKDIHMRLEFSTYVSTRHH